VTPEAIGGGGGLAVLTVLCGWAVWKIDSVVTTVVQIKVALCGMNGKGGALSDIEALKESCSNLDGRLVIVEQSEPTRYVPK